VVSFVEVKTRTTGPQDAAESLTPAQRRRIRRAAEAWIHAHPGVGREFRFDLAVVRASCGKGTTVELIPDAFFGDDLR
jgi:putative endonuclease